MADTTKVKVDWNNVWNEAVAGFGSLKASALLIRSHWKTFGIVCLVGFVIGIIVRSVL